MRNQSKLFLVVFTFACIAWPFPRAITGNSAVEVAFKSSFTLTRRRPLEISEDCINSEAAEVDTALANKFEGPALYFATTECKSNNRTRIQRTRMQWKANCIGDASFLMPCGHLTILQTSDGLKGATKEAGAD